MKNTLLTGSSLLSIIMIAFWAHWLPADTLLPSTLFVLIFTALMVLMQRLSASPSSESSFVRNFMGTIVVKLFSALIFLTIVLYTNKSNWETKEKIALSMVVFGTYIVFTVIMGKSQSRK